MQQRPSDTKKEEKATKVAIDFQAVKTLFTYGTIAKTGIVTDKSNAFASGYFPFLEKTFISFCYNFIKDTDPIYPAPQKEDTNINRVGWKLHIAVDDKDPENVAKAWNAIKDILIDYRLVEAKVIAPRVILKPDQCGKQITIYQFSSPGRDWNKMVNEIEIALRNAKVKIGKFNPSDRPIPNSSYISYRNDGDYTTSSESGKYLSGEEAIKLASAIQRNAFNPFNKDDPFAGIKVPALAESAKEEEKSPPPLTPTAASSSSSSSAIS